MRNRNGLLVSDANSAIYRMQGTQQEYALLARWLSDPVVLEFYEGRDHPHDLHQVMQIFSLDKMEQEGETPCLMVWQDTPVGYIQFYRADLQEYGFDEPGKVFGIDLFIGEAGFWGKGLGTRMTNLMVSYLFEQEEANWVILDPHIDNTRAIRCYEKCGFQKLKLLPQHEEHEGQLVDCWLMGIKKTCQGSKFWQVPRLS